MKFELKTENENYSKKFLYISKIIFILALMVLLCDVALKLGIISRNYQIDLNCRLLTLNKSTSNFKKLSKLSNFKSKQRILELCRGIVK